MGELTRRFPPSLLVVTALPALLTSGLWSEVWGGGSAQAWDGSGHHALARIYAEVVFPDTFGWKGAYLAGTALTNYYTPLFYFLVALLRKVGRVPLDAAFEVVLVLPTLLLPAVWLLGWRLSSRSRLAAACAALAALPITIDPHLSNSQGLMGLSYTSTFLLGLYTQTLGLVLLVGW